MVCAVRYAALLSRLDGNETERNKIDLASGSA